MATSLLTKPIVNCSRDEVYVAAVPQKGLLSSSPLPLTLSISGTSSTSWSSSNPPHHHHHNNLRLWFLIFNPKIPKTYMQLAVLSGKAIPGVILKRKLSKLPRSKCWFVGSSETGAVDIASEFNKGWETHLRVGHHDCRNYTNGLVECLTGETNVLDRLRNSDTST